MPLYPYRCTQCGHRFEKIQSFSDAPETVCPKCGGPLERPLTAPGLSFKGAGWYVNDYAPKSSSSSEGSAGTAESKPAAADSSSAASSSTPSASSSASSGSTSSASSESKK